MIKALPLKRWITPALLAGMVLTLPGLLICGHAAQNLRIYHIDVDQADATLFVSPAGNTLLVDSGKNGHGNRIKAVMDLAGVSQIDHLITTHYHEDHYGGIDELVNDHNITIVHAHDRGHKDESGLSGDRFEEYQAAVGNRAVEMLPGGTVQLDPNVVITCIAANGEVMNGPSGLSGGSENNRSIALLIAFGQFTYFIGGDIELTTEGRIAARDLVLDVDVYQANHHGAENGSSLPFLRDLRPRAVIISNGNHGGHRHPRQHTLQNFAILDSRPVVFQTNKYLKGKDGGNVADQFIADLEPSGDGGTILVTANGQSDSFVVSYRNQSHSFDANVPPSVVQVVIESLLPDPVGSDRQLEEVTLHNRSSQQVSLNGWALQDRGNSQWDLSGIGFIDAGQSVTIVRNGAPMSLSNWGDTISLLNENADLVDSFTYTTSSAGTVIRTFH